MSLLWRPRKAYRWSLVHDHSKLPFTKDRMVLKDLDRTCTKNFVIHTIVGIID